MQYPCVLAGRAQRTGAAAERSPAQARLWTMSWSRAEPPETAAGAQPTPQHCRHPAAATGAFEATEAMEPRHKSTTRHAPQPSRLTLAPARTVWRPTTVAAKEYVMYDDTEPTERPEHAVLYARNGLLLWRSGSLTASSAPPVRMTPTARRARGVHPERVHGEREVRGAPRHRSDSCPKQGGATCPLNKDQG